MPLVRTRPKHPIIRLNLRVGNARVVRGSPRARTSKLLEYFLRAPVAEVFALAQTLRKLAYHLHVVPNSVRRLKRPLPHNHAPFEVRHRAIFLRPLRRRQNHIRQFRSLRQEEVRHHQEVQRPQPPLHMHRIRRGHNHIRAEHQQRSHPTFLTQRVQQLISRLARSRQRILVDSPDRCHMLTCRRIVNLAVARQLVGLLPVLPAALSVPLPCQAAVPAVRLAHQSQRQRDIDKRQRIVDALSLLLSSPRRQHYRRPRLAQHACRLYEIRLRHARDPLHPLRPICRNRRAH